MNKNWKYEYHNKNNPIDFIWDLFDDTYKYLGKNKHIQDVKNFFKKFKITKYKDKNGYISQKSKDIFEQIVISEIQEIKFSKDSTKKIDSKKSKKQTIITKDTEPSIQQVMEALTIKTDYATIITNFIFNGIMYFFIILVGMYEAIKYLIGRLILAIKYLGTLPFRQMFNVVFRISVVIVAIGFSIFLFNYFQSVSTAQKMSDMKMEELKKEYNDINIRFENLQQEFNNMKASSVLIEHKIVSKEYLGRDGQIKRVEKIR